MVDGVAVLAFPDACGSEVDLELARSLAQRTASADVRVHCADATAMPYRARVFSGAVSFTMFT